MEGGRDRRVVGEVLPSVGVLVNEAYHVCPRVAGAHDEEAGNRRQSLRVTKGREIASPVPSLASFV